MNNKKKIRKNLTCYITEIKLIITYLPRLSIVFLWMRNPSVFLFLGGLDVLKIKSKSEEVFNETF